MLSAQEIQKWLDRNLLTIQKPGRYVGGELNQIKKEWDSVSTRIALCFPEIYDIGTSNTGLGILYDIVNKRQDTLCERTFLPWLDMESAMRKDYIPLYTLESKHPLPGFDIIGISLPYETLYTNAINLLDLAMIPVLSADRTENHPLIIAGGHATFNPEPMADFIDAYAIGDGEEVILEVIDRYADWKRRNSSRKHLLQDLAGIWGVYVPSFYAPVYEQSGKIKKIEKVEEKAPDIIKKRIVGRLPLPPTQPIVPSIDVVHNRVTIEIMRGCTRGCRFCQAGIVNRPVRERPIDEIIQALQQSLDHTGYEEVGLLSLSSSDYTQINELVDALNQKFEGQNLTVSLPSLRIETFSVNLLERLKDSRPGGFTLAPEAATDRMRSVINKPVPSDLLLETAREIYGRGWLTLKLYFMIGHPSETLEDVIAIGDLCRAVISEGRKMVKGRAKLHVGVSTFIPKPHTPFQWVATDTIERIEEKQHILRQMLKMPGVKINWTDTAETMLEAWLSRGDRRLGKAIYQAWRNGAKFDAWQDQFKASAWKTAFEDIGLDPSFYSNRERDLDEIFPWDHIHPGVNKKYLKDEYISSLEGITRGDCRNECFQCGVLGAYVDLRRTLSEGTWKCP